MRAVIGEIRTIPRVVHERGGFANTKCRMAAGGKSKRGQERYRILSIVYTVNNMEVLAASHPPSLKLLRTLVQRDIQEAAPRYKAFRQFLCVLSHDSSLPT